MTRSLSAFLLCIMTSVAWADGDAPRTIAITRDGRKIPSAFAPVTGKIPVIVQFRDTPLFARNASRAISSNAMTARFATFERDLASIERSRVASQAVAATPRIEQRYSRVFAGAALSVDGETLAQIQKLDYVRAVHIDKPVQKTLEHSVPKIRAPEVWATFGTRGSGVVVAIIDTGIDYNHPALGGGFGPGHRVAGGYDFTNRDADPMDDDGHGTHVAGIVGGNGGGITGVAPEVTFLAYKVLNDHGAGRESDIIAAIERASDPNDDDNPADHADVANLSLGGPGTPDDPLSQAVETASGAGVVFCIAAGNDGAFFTIGTPGNAPSAITVGATTINDELATFSSKGPAPTSLAIKPEVLAPGVDIVSAQLGGGTVEMSGTSMATPHVAGVAALLCAIHPEWSVAHIKAAIVGTAQALANSEAMAEGAGRVDAMRAAGADVVAAPSVLNLGHEDAEAAHWTTSATFTLVNHGNASRTLTLEAPSPHAGISITLDATSVVLAAGASREVRASFDVDNQQVPSPTEGSLSYSGTIQITGGAEPLHVPWAFVKAAIVTLDYDGNDPYEAIIGGITARVMAHVQAGPSVHRATALVPNGTYDVVVFPMPIFGDTRQRMIFVEQQTLANTKTIAVRRTQLAYDITPQAVDDQGLRLNAAPASDCEPILLILPPEDSSMQAILAGGSAYLSSAVSTRFTLSSFMRCIDRDHHRVFAGQFPLVRGISASSTPTIAANDWVRTPVSARMPDGLADPGVILFAGWQWHDAYATVSDLVGREERAPSWSGSLFLTKAQHPSLNAVGMVTLKTADGPFRNTVFDSPKIHVDDDGASIWPFSTKAPTSYAAPLGTPIVFGEGLQHIRTVFYYGDPILSIDAQFRGSLDESRRSDNAAAHFVLRDGAGAITRAGTANQFVMLAPPDHYDLEITSGTMTVREQFDTTREDDIPPTLNGMRLLSANGSNTSFLATNEAGSLLFATMDLLPAPEHQFTYAAIRTDSITARWRAHGATDWTPLQPVLLSTEVTNGAAEAAALGHFGVGTSYRVDLSAVSHAGPGAYDLTVRFEDVSGNAHEWTMAPALTVVDPDARRRSSRH